MGLRGPAPKPTALRVLEGRQGAKKKAEREPRPRRGIPDPPAWLTAEALAHWQRVAPDLDRAGVLCRVDADILAQWCSVVARLEIAEGEIEGDGMIIGTATGEVQSPWFRVHEKLQRQLVTLSRELGLSPSARSRISAEAGAGGGDPMEDLLSRG